MGPHAFLIKAPRREPGDGRGGRHIIPLLAHGGLYATGPHAFPIKAPRREPGDGRGGRHIIPLLAHGGLYAMGPHAFPIKAPRREPGDRPTCGTEIVRPRIFPGAPEPRPPLA